MIKAKLRKYGINEAGRDFVIGDIHGCMAHFKYLLQDVKFDKEVDRMFSVGDLVDRGPDSFKALKLIEEPWFHATMGNHEQMMIENVTMPDPMYMENWVLNGGGWAKAFIEQKDREFIELVNEAKKLPIAITVETSNLGIVGVCHAESPNSWIIGEQIDQHKVLWARDKYRWGSNMGKVPEGVDMTIHGHTPIGRNPIHHEKMNAWWIDTGCFATGVLTMLQISGKEIEDKPIVHKVEFDVVGGG